VLTLQTARNARTSLFSGVTTIRENGSKNATTLRLRDAVREGRETGPRMVLSGRPVSIIGGHMGYFGSEVTGPVEARAMVSQLVKEGADYIKITATGGSTRTSFPLLPAFDADELGAIVDEAHNLGRLTAAHCTSTQGTVNSLDAGVDMIIHSIFKDQYGNDEFREDVAWAAYKTSGWRVSTPDQAIMPFGRQHGDSYGRSYESYLHASLVGGGRRKGARGINMISSALLGGRLWSPSRARSMTGAGQGE